MRFLTETRYINPLLLLLLFLPVKSFSVLQYCRVFTKLHRWISISGFTISLEKSLIIDTWFLIRLSCHRPTVGAGSRKHSSVGVILHQVCRLPSRTIRPRQDTSTSANGRTGHISHSSNGMRCCSSKRKLTQIIHAINGDQRRKTLCRKATESKNVKDSNFVSLRGFATTLIACNGYKQKQNCSE